MSISTRKARRIRAGIMTARIHYTRGLIFDAGRYTRAALAAVELAAYGREFSRLHNRDLHNAQLIAEEFADAMTREALDRELDERTRQ